MAAAQRWLRYLLVAVATILLLYTFRETLVRRGVSRLTTPGFVSGKRPSSKFQWRTLPLRYPLESLTPLPSGNPVQLPKVQFDFITESDAAQQVRLGRQEEVKDSFVRCWEAYKRYAWMADELAPVSGGMKNPFGGWGATLVDSLDTLWIMDMKAEFEEAVTAALTIDFGASSLEEINVFETTIRYLGGFIAAYDLSGEQRLLDKAVELGDMLLVAFDTPNHMPITRWNVMEAKNGGPQSAHETTLVAEIGSLTMEFTRLSQITNDPRWYDAVDRVMQRFNEQQHLTNLPGMWPVLVNARTANFTGHDTFTLGAMSDSLYEYLPKMHALLGGLVPMYEKMYSDSIQTAVKHLLWRPMIEDEAADILMSGSASVHKDGKGVLEQQGQHLVCFAGGMFALGGRLFNQAEHVDVGRRLTDGCIWAYKALPMGVMPEVFFMSACPTKEPCKWDADVWKKDVLAHKQMTTEDSAQADRIIAGEALPPGFVNIRDRRYILRPEAIESVMILYRITGREELLDTAWDMFTAIQQKTKTKLANAAIADITAKDVRLVDSMESFWMAETLKYFYLIFSEPGLISLDEYVFNTEAHPFKRPQAA